MCHLPKLPFWCTSLNCPKHKSYLFLNRYKSLENGHKIFYLHTLFTLILYTSASLQKNKGFNLKKTLLTLSAAVLLTAPSLFAHENSLQEHLRIGQMLQKQEQKRLKNANGAMNQYKYQH